MQDGVTVANLTPGYDAYLSYVDGYYVTWPFVQQRFPSAHHLTMTTGLGAADGIDVEPGNVGWANNCAAVPGWVRGRIAAGVYRPVIYISASYGQMIIDRLAAAGIARHEFRLFAAHWTDNHLCGPGCGNAIADATQWACVDNIYDVSVLADDFFGPVPVPVVPPKPKPKVVQEDFMKIVIGTGVPSQKDPNPVFVLWGGTKRWLSTQALVHDWLVLAGQAAYVKCPWAVISVIPDAPGSTPVPL